MAGILPNLSGLLRDDSIAWLSYVFVVVNASQVVSLFVRKYYAKTQFNFVPEEGISRHFGSETLHMYENVGILTGNRYKQGRRKLVCHGGD